MRILNLTILVMATLFFAAYGHRNYFVFPLILLSIVINSSCMLQSGVFRVSTLRTVIWSLLWLVPCWLSVGEIYDFPLHVKATFEHAAYVFFVLGLVTAYQSGNENRSAYYCFIWVVLIALCVGAAFFDGLLQLENPARWSSVYGNANLLGAVSVILMFLSVVNAGKKILTLQMATCLLLVFASGSTAALLCSLLILASNILSKGSPATILGASIIIVLSIIWLGSASVNRAAEKVEDFYAIMDGAEYERSSAGVRAYLSEKAFGMVKESTFAGVGLNNSKHFLEVPIEIHPDENKDKLIDTQSNYLEVAVSGGLIALLVYYLPLNLFLFMIVFSPLTRRKLSSIDMSPALLATGIVCALILDIGAKSYNVFPYIAAKTALIYIFFEMLSISKKNLR